MKTVIWFVLIAALGSLPGSAADASKSKHCSVDASNEIALPQSPHGQSTDGTLLLRVVIGDDGCTQDIRVIQDIRKKIDRAVVDAVQAWRFEPAMHDGKPVKVLVQLSVKIVEKDGRLYLAAGPQPRR